ncbi:MAG: putative proton glutamate symport protein GltP [Bacteroidota bacterium]|jgi:Na+/H+-dicarboxylate symporter
MKKRSNLLTLIIFVSMLVGIGVGYLLNRNLDYQSIAKIEPNLKLLSVIFMRLVQMVIAPLVFSTLVVGIAKLGDLKTVGRVGGKAMLWFVSASLVSLLIGLFWVNLLQPGAGFEVTDEHAAMMSEAEKVPAKPAPVTAKLDSSAVDSLSGDSVSKSLTAMDAPKSNIPLPVAPLVGKAKQDSINLRKVLADKEKGFNVEQFVTHIFPKSIVEAMATNEILQIVIFSIFFGMACSAIGERAKPVIMALDSLAHIILKMVGYVMNFAPIGVFGSITAAVAVHGLESIVVVYLKYFGAFLLGIASLWVVLLLVGYLILGKRLGQLIKRIMNPMAIAFSTTSSEAVFPKMVEELERFGCKNQIVSFILPLGYSFNLDGSMMYMTFASIFIAQVYGVHLDIATQLTMLLVLMLTSKGIAGVPRASLVVVTATCAMFGVPPEGIALILPIDHFCDMFRSMTNVVGNALATSAVSKWEGGLGPQHEIRDAEPL